MDSFGLDTFDSRSIYKDFIAGKIINAFEFMDGELQPSKKYRSLVDNIDKYRELYSLLGFEIKSVNSDAFFITRFDRAEELNEVAANIQVLLTVLSRGLCTQGTSPNILADQKSGISARDIDAIGEMDEVVQILTSCKLQSPLTRQVNAILVERGVMHRTRQDRYILSSAGQHFFGELFG